MVYLDSDKVVVHLEENLKPWRMAPVRLKATSVLELPGSTLSSTQTAIGDEDRNCIGTGRPGVNDAPNFLVEWPSRWDEFLTAIGPAMGKSPKRLAGEAQVRPVSVVGHSALLGV